MSPVTTNKPEKHINSKSRSSEKVNWNNTVTNESMSWCLSMLIPVHWDRTQSIATSVWKRFSDLTKLTFTGRKTRIEECSTQQTDKKWHLMQTGLILHFQAVCYLCSVQQQKNKILLPDPNRKLLLLPAGLQHFTLSLRVSPQPNFHSSFWHVFHPRHAAEEAKNKRKEGKRQTAWRENKNWRERKNIEW